MDVDAIAPGIDFVRAIGDEIAKCNVLLAVIGPGWADAKDESGRQRLDDPTDYVRAELESAFQRDIRVIPVLVDGARMPRTDDLPNTLQNLTRLQAVELTHHKFSSDVNALAITLKDLLPVGAAITAAQRSDVDNNDGNPRNVAEIAFGFQGRISRRTYWKALLVYLLFTIIVSIFINVFFIATELSAGKNWNEVVEQMDTWKLTKPDWRLKVLSCAFGVLMLWPLSALILKRLHDFGQGAALFSAVALVYVPLTLAFYVGYDQVTPYTLVFVWTLLGFIGLIAGTKGRNGFGPDPLVSRGGSGQT
jgi:uncharacterized membrane protein YhaH (DUF805 family)